MRSNVDLSNLSRELGVIKQREAISRETAEVKAATKVRHDELEALVSLSRHETMVKVAEAWSVQRLVEGDSLGDTLSRLFNNTPLKPLLDKLVTTNGADH
ncbi:MAG: hypothetical protein ABI867_00215 [Kofleriaceae bacterium]